MSGGEAMNLLEAIQYELAATREISAALYTEPCLDGIGHETVLEWSHGGVHSTIAINSNTNEAYYLSHSTAGELADVDFPSVEALEADCPLLLANDACGWTEASKRYVAVLAKIREELRVRGVEPLLIPSETGALMLEWAHAGVLANISVWAEHDEGQFCSFRHGDRVFRQRYESLEELERDYLIGLDAVVPITDEPSSHLKTFMYLSPKDN